MPNTCRALLNIDDLLVTLNNDFRRLRQSGIDEELFDVVAGYEALTTGVGASMAVHEFQETEVLELMGRSRSIPA